MSFENGKRCWFFTWTTYGTWLPGDDRGHASKTRDAAGNPRYFNQVQTHAAPSSQELQRYAANKMRGPQVKLSQPQAVALLQQLKATSEYRGWNLLGVAIMANHVHVLLVVEGDPDPENILRDLKSYGSRALNRSFARPASDTWWTKSGSKRRVNAEENSVAVRKYILEQDNPLVLWVTKEFD